MANPYFANSASFGKSTPQPGTLGVGYQPNAQGYAQPNPYAKLRRWAHRFGFGGHFLTKSRRHRVGFTALRLARIVFHRTTRTSLEPGAGPSQQRGGSE